MSKAIETLEKIPGEESVQSVLLAVKKEAAEIDRYMRADISLLQAEVDDLLYQILDYGLFNGGKRVRPLLVVLASRICGNGDNDAYRLGTAFEYLHAATLFHDDIIDQSETRRGKQSVYRKFGLIGAILAGDFLHAKAMATVGRYSGQEGLQVFCRATTGMVDGEFMQLKNADKHSLSELDYYDAIMGKTGLLIAAACEVGALFGGGDQRQVNGLRDYGEHLGCAYQIVDDLLDYLGDPGKTGKVPGNDLAEGKMTLPLILTINAADETDCSRLMQILADNERRLSGFKEVCSIIAKYDCFSAARKRAETAVEEACKALGVFSGNSGVEKHILEGLARYVLSREK